MINHGVEAILIISPLNKRNLDVYICIRYIGLAFIPFGIEQTFLEIIVIHHFIRTEMRLLTKKALLY